MLLTSLCVPVPRPMPFPPASAHAAPKFMLLHSPSHFYFPFFQLSSLFPLPFFNAVQPFFSLHAAECKGEKKKKKTNASQGQSGDPSERASNAAQGAGAKEGRAGGYTECAQ